MTTFFYLYMALFLVNYISGLCFKNVIVEAFFSPCDINFVGSTPHTRND